MEIILKQDVINLGYKDDIVTVKNGYANNYLLPQGLAIIATPANKKMHEETLRQLAFKEARAFASPLRSVKTASCSVRSTTFRLLML